MKLGRARFAAAALAAATLVPWPVRGDPLSDAEREAARIEERLARVEAAAAGPDEDAAARAARQLAEGERQYLLGDWAHAAALLASAVEDPTVRARPGYPRALFDLADALRRSGACAPARTRYEEVLALPADANRGAALAGAIECAVKDRHPELVERLLPEAQRASGDVPPEVRYLVAKALYARTDLRPAERIERALAAFAAVPAPYLQQAAYFEGVLLLDRGDPEGAAARFEACWSATAQDERQREVRDLCALALGRLHGDAGRAGEAVDWYERVPRESPHFTEATYESAWSLLKAGRRDAALRTAALVADLAPESPLAPEATVLQGNLLLESGRFGEATEAYSRVLNAFAPVRDELDAILALHEDPVRYFDELVGREGEALDVATVLPPVAVKWAATQPALAGALAVVRELDSERREVREAGALADRVDALLSEGNGLDAFPALRAAYADAEAAENAAAVAEGRAMDAALAAAPALVGGDVAEAHAARVALQARTEALPRTAAEVRARADRARARLGELDREAYRLGYELESATAAITAAEAWLAEHRAELEAAPDDRATFTEELRKHREMVARYAEELRRVQQEVARARDAAGGTAAIAEERALRDAYLAALAREREVLAAARGRLGVEAGGALDRAAALAERLTAVRARARAAAERVQERALGQAGALRERIAEEKLAVAAEVRALDAVQGDARALFARQALASFQAVRDQFYRLVLAADVGLVDVAWARKRARGERIQELSARKATELRELDEGYRAILREVE